MKESKFSAPSVQLFERSNFLKEHYLLFYLFYKNV